VSGGVSDAIFGFMIASSITGMALNTAMQLMPGPHGADFYSFEAVHVADTWEGQPVMLAVDREIHMDFQGRYSVTVRHAADNGWQIACDAASPWRNYRRGSAPLGEVTLDWWTGGACAVLPIGLNEICTTITVRAPGEPAVTECSNVFRVWPRNDESRR
jgi:hypothetical protein